MKYDIKNLNVGDQLILKDEVSLRDMLKEGRGIKGAHETITHIREFKAKDNLFSYKIYSLEGDYERFLLLKMVDDLMDVRVYMNNGWLNPGTREDWVQNDYKWLFQPPEKTDFNPNDLEFTFDMRLDKNFYEQKQDTVYGELRDTPRKTGLKYPLFSAAKEFIFSSEGQKENEFPDCKEILLLDTDGWCEFLEGYSCDSSDIEVFTVNNLTSTNK